MSIKVHQISYSIHQSIFLLSRISHRELLVDKTRGNHCMNTTVHSDYKQTLSRELLVDKTRGNHCMNTMVWNNSRTTHIHQISRWCSRHIGFFSQLCSGFFLLRNFFLHSEYLSLWCFESCCGSLMSWLCCHGVEQQQDNTYPPNITLV